MDSHIDHADAVDADLPASTVHSEHDRPSRQPPKREDRPEQPPDHDGRPQAKPQTDKDAPDDNKAEDGDGEEKKKPRPLLPFIIFGVVVAIGATGGVVYWLHARHYESTDDAFVDGYVSQIASQVAGHVVRLAVQDNQQVQAGDVLVNIDPRDFQEQLDQAEAQRGNAAAAVEQARAQLALQQTNVGQAEATVRVAQADLTQAQQDLARYRAVDPRAVTRQQVDTSTAQTRSAQARLDASQQAVAGAVAQVKAAEAQVAAMEASLRQADVAVSNAKLQLSYTHVVAPTEGRVTRRTVDLGNYVSPGQALMALVPRTMWVTANFKETQLADMKPGQKVAIDIDAFGSITFNGVVDSFQRGTGSVFSTLPAENATGNYVKVVQRLPVKIVFDDDRVKDYPLAPGMSVVPSVTVR